MNFIQEEPILESVMKEIEETFEYDDDIDVYIYPSSLRKSVKEGGKLYTVRVDKKLVGCALVEFGVFEKTRDREQIENGTPFVCIAAMQIHEDYQARGYGKLLTQFLEKMYQGKTMILFSRWRAYRFWKDAMGYQPVELEDEDDQTWLYKVLAS